jgi:aldehyde dehydrogenase (NAD+)
MTSPTGAHDIALRAYRAGVTAPLSWRRRQLVGLSRLLSDHQGELEKALHQDLGKHPLESQLTEISIVQKEITGTLSHLTRWTRPRRVRLSLQVQPAIGRVIREPLGTVLIIAPWNYPLHLLLLPMVGAIGAGNAVVLKPSELAPATSAVIARLVPRYLDREAVQVVEGAVDETTELLACAWDHIFFTGTGTVGRIVLKAAADHLTPVTLELGGKSPFWVDPSADIEDAAGWLAWGTFLNAGQTCIAPDHVLTTPEVVPRLTEALRRKVREMFSATPEASPDFGRIVSDRHFDRLSALLGSGSVVIGGETDREQRYIAPTVLTDVTAEDPIMQEEIFGPILPILTVRDHEAAIDLIDAGPKPLALYVFTRDREVERDFVERTSSGAIVLNAALAHIAEQRLPFGGVGESGMGSYHGERSLALFSHERAYLRKLRGPNLPTLAGAPYTEQKERLLGLLGARVR